MTLHVTGEVLDARTVGAYRHLSIAAPGVAERLRPGTFVAVTHGDSAHLARRSYWIHQVRPLGGHGPVLQLVVEPVGTGGRWLAGLAAGARLGLTGPLGRPFALPKEPVTCLLVGEDVSAAPLFPLAERLREPAARCTCWSPAGTRPTCCRRSRRAARPGRSPS